MSSLTEIAERILINAKHVDSYLSSKGLPPSTFANHTLNDMPEDFESYRKELVDSTQTLKRLALGPVGLYMEILFSFTDLLSIRVIYRYNIPKYVPIDGDISFGDLAQASHLDEGLLRRFVQHAAANRIFAEDRAGYVRHTAASRLLNEDPEAMDTVGFLMEDLFPASTKVLEAMEKYPGSGEPNQTGFNVEFQTSDPFYLELGKNAERSRRFGAGMRFMTRGTLYDIDHLIHGYDWSSLDKASATVVDIGGGHGGVSRALASVTSNLQFIVQDLPGTVDEGRKILPQQLKDRVTFMSHDFLTPQPVKGANIYFFRFILHNWSDKYATKILESLLPAMKDGSRVVIYEFLPSEVADTSWINKHSRNLDMIQTTCWNSLERTNSGWRDLFTRVDPKFVYLGSKTPHGSAVSLIEAEYRA